MTTKIDPENISLLEEYIARIGEQINVIRSRRGMIRKDLSIHSGVSERYLAQAETGKANISISLLWRIAHALDVEIADLLAESFARALNTTLLNFIRNMDASEQEAAFCVLKSKFSKTMEKGYGVALIGWALLSKKLPKCKLGS